MSIWIMGNACPLQHPAATGICRYGNPAKESRKGLFMKSLSSIARSLFSSALLIPLFALAASPAPAQTFKVVYTFTGGNDGGRPLDGFTADTAGNLYATSFYGGAYGNGVVFKVTPSGAESVLYSFAGGTDGANPEGGLILDKSNNIYGTTTAGGAYGSGTVFEISSTGEESVLYSFAGGKDGSAPESALVLKGTSYLYGTTTAGGASGSGTVFRLTLNEKTGKWTEKILHSFAGSKDGSTPVAGVAFDKAGNLYGTASAGGTYGYGTIFELEKGSWTEITLHDFQDGDDGAVPYAALIADKSGNFYGAATEGGSAGGGAVFKLTPSGSTWTFSAIYSNPGWGISGSFRSLTLDSSGNLYGTTHCDGNYSSGTVYELSPSGSSWNFTSLYNFTGGSDGQYSFSNPVLVENHLYGTTNVGGANGVGVVWEVTL
jgi:uncharacterized repeat protein (TIGR03803 family)